MANKKYAQIYQIVNTINQQMFGSSAVAVVDTSTFVSLGNTITASDDYMDVFTSKLIDRIGYTIIVSRTYEGAKKSLFRDGFEFGAILQKIDTDVPDAQANTFASLTADMTAEDMLPKNVIPTVNVTYFTGFGTWDVQVTVPDTLLKTAFTDEVKMGAFISDLFTKMANKMELAEEGVADLAVNTFIASRFNAKESFPACARNLLHEFNTLTNKTLTVGTCMTDKDFLRYASKEINRAITNMTKYSTLFNVKGSKKFTPKDRLKAFMLAEFNSAFNTYLSSDTFHNELIALPNFEEVAYWQGSGTTFAFEDCSKVEVANADFVTEENTTGEVKVSGVICAMFDEECVGYTRRNDRAGSMRNNYLEKTDTWYRGETGFFVDNRENGIIFYVAEV